MEKDTILGILAALFKLMFLKILPSFLDITSDIVNSLDMLGYNATRMMGHGALFEPLLNATNTSTSFRQDPIWGMIGLALVFSPGIPCLLFLLIFKRNEKDCSSKVVYLLAICYPLATIILWFGNVLGIILDYHQDKNFLLRELCAGEAFFESCPQMILQLFTIQYGYPFGPLQGVTIALSFILLTKASVMFEWPKKEDRKIKWRAVLSTLPLFTTSIIFRVGSLSLITAYLRYWSIIPVLIRCLAYGLIAFWCGYRDNLPIAMLANIGTITSGVVTNTSSGNPQRFKFLRISTIYTFLHLTTVLIFILAIAHLKPDIFSHWESDLVYFGQKNYIFPSVIFVGIVNLFLMKAKLTKEMVEIFELSSENKCNETVSF